MVLFILTAAQVLDEDDDGRAEQVSILASVLSGQGSLVVSFLCSSEYLSLPPRILFFAIAPLT